MATMHQSSTTLTLLLIALMVNMCACESNKTVGFIGKRPPQLPIATHTDESFASDMTGIHLYGAVTRPGVYNPPEGDKLTLKQLLAGGGALGSMRNFNQTYALLLRRHDDGSLGVSRRRFAPLFSSEMSDIWMELGDIVIVCVDR